MSMKQAGREWREGRNVRAVGNGRRPGDRAWLPFPGGELEAPAPRRLCRACRERSERGGDAPGTLCFDCYRADRERERAVREAVSRDTTSAARLQEALPFEPVNRVRLEQLRVERTTAREKLAAGPGRFEVRRRQALVAARHALARATAGVRPRGAATPEDRRALAMAVHAAELQLPESWLPFVVAR